EDGGADRGGDVLSRDGVDRLARRGEGVVGAGHRRGEGFGAPGGDGIQGGAGGVEVVGGGGDGAVHRHPQQPLVQTLALVKDERLGLLDGQVAQRADEGDV